MSQIYLGNLEERWLELLLSHFANRELRRINYIALYLIHQTSEIQFPHYKLSSKIGVLWHCFFTMSISINHSLSHKENLVDLFLFDSEGVCFFTFVCSDS